jgi:hypothetical protein
MRALAIPSFGPPKTIELLDVPEPTITGPEDIIVAVKAVGLNPGDPIRAAGWSKVLENIKSVDQFLFSRGPLVFTLFSYFASSQFQSLIS